ncbi:MAG: glycosyltransferase family 4 protein [Prevotellaceae bacterium]|nr:glycosyltransferase family 4 protein [Prevotellaceae bacterium]
MWYKEVEKNLNITDNIKVIYNPCTVEPLKNTYIKQNVILFAGSVNCRKGYSDLIKAFGRIAHSHPQWELHIAGNGEIEQGKALAKKLNIEEQVKFLGWVDGEDKDREFYQSSIFCLPSYAEGFPMAVLDAWAYELPVITTPVGAFRI